ncbi:MAG: PIN domain-containing protein [Opitutaceae bacterium]|nr:PIN domain-containing protein [Opitutaceae bacterium]
MASLVLPDSNFFIRSLRTGLDPFALLVPVAAKTEFVTCGVVIAEVTRGLRAPTLRQRFEENFALMTCVPTTAFIWERVAQLAWSLDRAGTVLQLPDLIIAATALEADATVLTFDAHFKKIPGLRATDRLPPP